MLIVFSSPLQTINFSNPLATRLVTIGTNFVVVAGVVCVGGALGVPVLQLC